MAWLAVILISVAALPGVSIASEGVPIDSARIAVRASEGPGAPMGPGGLGMILQPNVVGGGSFDIEVNILGGLTPSQEAIFAAAEATWEGVLVGYLPGGTTYAGPLVIDAEGIPIDGVGGILGMAGPTFVWDDGSDYLVSTQGVMSFDSADLANMENNGSLGDVIVHEMAHVIGFGTLWNPSNYGHMGYQEVYVDGSGQFTGDAALDIYKGEFNQPGAAFVPVELSGGGGTADSHWNENYGGAGLTGIVDGDGNDMTFELMTGWLNFPTFLSQTTLDSFEDIGYEVIPEPATVSLLVLGAVAVVRRRRGA